MARDILSDDSSDSDTGGAALSEIELKVNQDYAKRFEYNKKREELARLEEKHGNASKKRKRGKEDVSSDSDSSSSEDEDEEAEFATEALDSEIMATLNAIKSKDPRVYDEKSTFYTDFDAAAEPSKSKQEKAMTLRDYHRQNLLNGGAPVADQDVPMSYNQQQENLKRQVIGEMHAAADSDADSESEQDDKEEGFLVRKSKPESSKPVIQVDVETADKDPETFLSNFMAARAWVPTEKSNTHAFESDDEEEERRADQFEEAYNMRFEDPAKSNETLRTYGREMAAQKSVRRDEKSARQRKRDLEKEQKEAEKQQRKEEKARLKKLKMEEIEEKIRRIKRAGGLKTGELQPEDWSHLIDDDWDDKQWEDEMQRRYNDQYYAEDDVVSDAEDADGSKKRKKPKKPKFDDDIDINDIIPDFKADDDIPLSSSDGEEATTKKKNHKQLKAEKQKASKKERRILEQLVDDQLQMELQHSIPNAAKSAGFRYRETSPTSFGLTARDILLAEDKQLNEFAGLKKLAAFRDEEKKKKDKKNLGKKARLRKWRKDTFGDEEGLQEAELIPSKAAAPTNQSDDDDVDGGVNIISDGKKKRRRKKKQKTGEQEI